MRSDRSRYGYNLSEWAGESEIADAASAIFEENYVSEAKDAGTFHGKDEIIKIFIQ